MIPILTWNDLKTLVDSELAKANLDDTSIHFIDIHMPYANEVEVTITRDGLTVV